VAARGARDKRFCGIPETLTYITVSAARSSDS
jgi:hypothetical protein